MGEDLAGLLRPQGLEVHALRPAAPRDVVDRPHPSAAEVAEPAAADGAERSWRDPAPTHHVRRTAPTSHPGET